MRRLTLPLLAACTLLLALAPAATPAQQAAPGPAPLLLTAAELELWHTWVKGDHSGCYAAAQQMLDGQGLTYEGFSVALALQVRCASELGWHTALEGDLARLLPAYDGQPEADLLRFELMQCQRHTGRLDGIAANADALGCVKKWWVAGPFANERSQGFEDAQEPEENIDLAASYTGKDGQKVSWQKLPVTAPDGTVDLGAMLRPRKEAVAFLMTAVWVEPGAEPVTPSLASTDQVRLWRLKREVQVHGTILEADFPLGVPLVDQDYERSLGFDQGLADGALGPGWNVLVLKSGVSDGDWKLNLRCPGVRVVVDEDELAAALAETKPVTHVRSLDKPPTPAGFRSVCDHLLRPRLDRVTALPRTTMADVFADYESEYASAPEATRLALKPERAVMCYVSAWANRSASRVAAGREENRRRELLKQCLEYEPAAARAALELAQYYTGTFANPALADQYAAQAARLAPTWVEARVFAARVLQMKGLNVEVERELAVLLKEQPDHPQVLRFAGYYAGLREDYAASNKLFERALAADFDDSYTRDRLIDRAVLRGDLTAALKHATDARKLDPFDIRCAAQLAELLGAQGKFSLAERELSAALKIAPRDDDLLSRLGELLAMWAATETGDKAVELNARSLQRYRDALDANPNREDVLRYIEFMDRERPKFEAALQQDISGRIAAALKAPLPVDSPWQVVYRDRITVINEDGTTSVYSQEARRVLNDDGRDSLQSVRAPAWGDQQSRCVEAKVWRADGSVEEARRSSYGATFSTLEIGDIVHTRFRVSDLEQSFFGDFFGAREVLADFVPVSETRLVYVLPNGREFFDYTTNGAPARVASQTNGQRVWSYTATGLDKIVDEPLAPPADQRAAMVQISTYKSWHDFGRWYHNLIRKQLEPTPEMAAKVRELIANAATEKEKVRAIYNWVVTAVRYNADWHFGVHGYKPFSAGAVFARCIGDCKDKAILMCAMLGLAGIKAYPVIINLEPYRGNEDITLPMPHHFNHCIACVEYADGKTQFLDGTTTYNGMDELPSGDAGANVIVVKPDGGVVTRVPIPGPEADQLNDEISAEILDNGGLRLKVTRTAKGDSASTLRANYQREGDRKRMLEREWADFFPGAKVSAITTGDLADLDAPASIAFTVELPGAVTGKDGEKRMRLALNPRQWGKTQYASLTTRKTDMLLPPPYTRSSTWTFTLPANTTPVELPAKFEAVTSNARLATSAAMEGGKLVIRRSYAMLGGTVAVADYAAWRRALLDFDAAETATLRLKTQEQR